MELSRILIRELTDLQIIELREAVESEAAGTNGDSADEPAPPRTFPIVIGLPEAQAIERRLKGVQITRPQTHDLLANLIREMGGTLESITITDLAEHTFFATLDIRRDNGEELHVDCRPSDAIALGIAEDVPIFVEEHVLDAASNDQETE